MAQIKGISRDKAEVSLMQGYFGHLTRAELTAALAEMDRLPPKDDIAISNIGDNPNYCHFELERQSNGWASRGYGVAYIEHRIRLCLENSNAIKLRDFLNAQDLGDK
jgi:hypothetical protein